MLGVSMSVSACVCVRMVCSCTGICMSVHLLEGGNSPACGESLSPAGSTCAMNDGNGNAWTELPFIVSTDGCPGTHQAAAGRRWAREKAPSGQMQPTGPTSCHCGREYLRQVK